jgi:hypothetical protein
MIPRLSMTRSSLSRLTLAAAVAFGILALGDAARAQPAPSAAAIGYAKELVSLKGGASMFDPLVAGVIESAKNSLVPTNPQLSKELNDVATQLRKEYDPKRAEVLNEVAKIYAQHFSEQELKEIVAFYQTPVGKKMITEEPIALNQSLAAAQAWATRFSDEVLERFRAEMKKKGHPL